MKLHYLTLVVLALLPMMLGPDTFADNYNISSDNLIDFTFWPSINNEYDSDSPDDWTFGTSTSASSLPSIFHIQ